MKRLASAAVMAVAATSLVLAAAPANAARTVTTTRKACTKGGGHVVQKPFAGGSINVCSGGKENGKMIVRG
jgi:hypothetical protein